MSVLTVTPTADTVIELEDDRNYYVVTVEWEWSATRYVMTSLAADLLAAEHDITKQIASWPRDEGFAVRDVQRIPV